MLGHESWRRQGRIVQLHVPDAPARALPLVPEPGVYALTPLCVSGAGKLNGRSAKTAARRRAGCVRTAPPTCAPLQCNRGRGHPSEPSCCPSPRGAGPGRGRARGRWASGARGPEGARHGLAHMEGCCGALASFTSKPVIAMQDNGRTSRAERLVITAMLHTAPLPCT